MYPMFAFVALLFASAECLRRTRPAARLTRVPPAIVRPAISAHTRRHAVADANVPAGADRQAQAVDHSVTSSRPAPVKRRVVRRAGPPQLTDDQREQSRNLLETVRDYLEADNFACSLHEQAGFVECGFRGKNGLFVVRIAAAVNPLSLGVLVRIPLVVPDDRRLDMAEAVTRVNYGLLLGSFDFNLTDRTLRFRNSMPVADGTLTQEQFRRLLYAALASVNRYDRAFNRLLFADGLSAAEVVAEVEMAD
jgi:hypothetical protein